MIRPATLADLPALTALEAELFGPDAWNEVLVRQEIETVKQEIYKRVQPVQVNKTSGGKPYLEVPGHSVDFKIAGDADPAVAELAGAALGEIRKAKSEAKKSLKTPLATVVVTAPADQLGLLAPALDDLREAGNAAALDTSEGDALSVAVTFAEEPAD